MISMWTNENRFTGINLILFIVHCIIGFTGILSGIYFISFIHYHGATAAKALGLTPYVLLIIGIAVLYVEFLHYTVIARRNYNSMVQKYKTKEIYVTIIFDNEQIIIRENKEKFSYKYSDITCVKDKGNTVVIHLTDNTIIHIYKDRFESGCWTDCKRLISINCSHIRFANKKSSPNERKN